MQRSGRRGQAPALDVAGLPADRTICPACHGLPAVGPACRVCLGRPVCPTCRAGRLLSVPGPAIAYRLCPDCCDPAQGFTATGAPQFSRNPRREAATILAYRERQRSAAPSDAEMAAVLGGE
jgi:hypothetical protein